MNLGINLTEGSVWKKYIRFLIPIILLSILQQLYNTVDAIVAGKFAGDTALAAVGATSSLINLMLNLFLGLAIGTNVVCSRFYGACDHESLQNAIHTSIFLSVISGTFLAIAGFFISKPMLVLMGTPNDVLEPATLYMRVFFMGSPVSMLFNFGSAVLRAAGDTKRPLYILAISGIANVLINLFCVIVLKLGVLGVALGTVASQLISAIMVVSILLKTNTEFKLYPKKLRIHAEPLKTIASVGIPSGFNGMLFSFSNVIIQSTLNTFGKAVIAGTVAAGNIEILGSLPISAAEQAVVTFTGQNIGAKKFDRVVKGSRIAMLFSIVTSLVFLGLILLFGQELLWMFADKNTGIDVVNAGMVKLSIVSSSIILLVPSTIYGGVLEGMGKAFIPAVINVIFTCLLRVLWMIFIFPLHPTLNMILLVYPVSWGLVSIAVVISYLVIKNKCLK